MKALQVNGISVCRGERRVIENLSFHINEQQRFFVQGEIGTGKSTLLLALLGFIPILQGEIHLFGHCCRTENDFVPFRGTIGLCFQQADDQLFGPSVLDDVAFGPLNQGIEHKRAYQIALNQLERLDIMHLKDRAVSMLSGGEKNFTALAGVLAMQPKMLFLDEPTNGLDSKNCDKLITLLQQLALPMLIASHSQDLSRQLADDILTL